MMSRLDLLLVAGVALLALGCSGDDAGTTPQSGTSAAYSPPDSASAYPTPPPPPIPPSDQAIRDFIFGCTGAAGDANQAANELANCAPPDASKSRAEAAAGAMPIVLVDFLSAAPGSECFFTKSYVTWKDPDG